MKDLRTLVVDHLAAIHVSRSISPDHPARRSASVRRQRAEDALLDTVGRERVAAVLGSLSWEPPRPPPWWRSARCLALVFGTVLCGFAIAAVVALRLRVTDAAVQLETCQRELRCLQNAAACR